MDSHKPIGNMSFTYAELLEAVKEKRVNRRGNQDGTLHIYNYSDSVQYLNAWDEITMNCRGLILDPQGKIVARPWKKFFNLGQVDLPIQFDTPVEVMDKADGSLGILYPVPPDKVTCTGFAGNFNRKQEYAIATRGSFDSSQAWHATRLWRAKYSHLNEDIAKSFSDYTFLFEIIYPRNRVVLDYKGMDDLMLLGAVENSTGYYFGPKASAAMLQWPGPVVETMPFNTMSEALANTDRNNAEGFVIRSHNFMVKIKQPDYLELHKLVTNLSPKSVWDQLRSGKSETDIISNFPDEFHDDVKALIKPLKEAYEKRSGEILNGYHKVMHTLVSPERKEIAKVFSKYKDKHYYFALLDGNSISDAVWKDIKPKEEL